MPESNESRPSGSKQRDRKAELAALIERASREPGLVELLSVYRQDWFQLSTKPAQKKLSVSRTVRLSTDSARPLL